MTRRATVLLVAWVAAGCAAAPAAPVPGETEPGSYRGAADASAAVALDRRTILVADDEDNVLRLYDRERGGLPLSTLDVSAFLGLDADEEADIEGAARVGDRIYWITSHGRNRKGKLRAARQRLFATDVSGRPLGLPCTTLLPGLLRAIEPVVGRGEPVELEIEALSAGPDRRTLWIGLRAPLVRVDGARGSIVVPLYNASAVVEGGEAPDLGPPELWDLTGLSPRDMLWSATRREVLVLAGAERARGEWAIWRWSGRAGEPPDAEPLVRKAAADVQPEALVEIADDSTLWVLSDDGERPIVVRATAECSPGDLRDDRRCPNKHLTDDRRKSFRGFAVAP